MVRQVERWLGLGHLWSELGSYFFLEVGDSWRVHFLSLQTTWEVRWSRDFVSNISTLLGRSPSRCALHGMVVTTHVDSRGGLLAGRADLECLILVLLREQAGVIHLQCCTTACHSLLGVQCYRAYNVIGCANTLTSLPCSAPVLRGAPDVIEAAMPTHPQRLGYFWCKL